ncbi:MAG: T9SS type A sorting domain-containing protein [Bacteroidales bacterium]|nr:T9SS type A sorting domain-containing protein [Bacteroidales bacterium]
MLRIRKNIIQKLSFGVTLFLFLFFNQGFAQVISISNSIAVDLDSDGYFDAIEFEFSGAITDLDFETSTVTNGEWEFSLTPNFSSPVTASSYSTSVSRITSTTNVTDDKYVRVNFVPDFTTGNGVVYYRYTGSSISNLSNFTLASAADRSPPVVTSVSSDASGNGSLGIGESITFTIDIFEAEGDLSISPTQYNGQTITWSTSDGGDTYVAQYVVDAGHLSQSTPLQLTSVVVQDANGNTSTAQSTTNVQKGIDATIPVISSVTSTPTVSDTIVKIGENIVFTVDIVTSEVDLSISPTQYNGESITWSTTNSGNTYTATYTVVAGNSDRTTPLQLTNVTATDTAGNQSVAVNGTDVVAAIDANAPSISSVTSDATSAGVLKIGDQITFTVDVAGLDPGLTITPTTYNGQTISWSTSNGGDTYTATYTVTQGNSDQSSALQLTSVVATDAAGNQSATVNGTDVQKTIDANPPSITNYTVPQTTKINGTQYTTTINVSSDADVYSLVSGDLAGLSLHSLSKTNNATYTVNFTVSNLGADILAGASYTLNNLVLEDGAGNRSAPYSTTINQPNDPIYMVPPTASTSGTYEVCDQATVDLIIQLTGNPPWQIQVSDGTTTTSVTGINTSPHLYSVTGVDENGIADPDIKTYRVTQVTDVNGIVTNNVTPSSATVNVRNIPNVDITSPATDQTYNLNAVHDILHGSPSGGTFSGSGVVQANDAFYPSVAGIGAHEIIYTYTDPVTGCSDTDTVELTVINSQAEISFQNGDDWYCDYESSFTISATVLNDPSIVGTFTLDPPSPALSSTGDNAASINIQQLTGGAYNVNYDYSQYGIDYTVVKSFTIESLQPNVGIPPLSDFCEDYDTVFVNAVNLTPPGGTGTFIFSGASSDYFVNDPNGNGMYFYPDSLDPGSYDLRYFYETPNGCYSDTTLSYFTVHSLPFVHIQMNDLYNINDPAQTIQGSPSIPAGSFTPAFMNDQNNGTAIFTPNLVGLGIDTAYYTYTDGNGCMNTDTAIFTINEALGYFTGFNKYNGKNQYCYFNGVADTIGVVTQNGDGTPGTFYIDGVVYSNVIGTDSIAFIPSDIGSGDHMMRFVYTQSGVSFNLDTVFTVDSIGDLAILNLDDEYCINSNVDVNLVGTSDGAGIGDGAFTGNGITDPVGVFNPINSQVGDNTITYTFTRTSTGCIKSVDSIVTLNRVPSIGFGLSGTCISGPLDSVTFISDTAAVDNIVRWNWSVSALGNSRTSTLESPKFSLVSQQRNFIELELESDKGCIAAKDSSIFIGSVVDLDFTWDQECFGEVVTFDLVQYTDTAGVDSVVWDFGGDGVEDISDLMHPQFTYDAPGQYDVSYTEYTLSCGIISDTLMITIRPSITVDADGYFENFEQEPVVTGWSPDMLASTSNYSWDWGVPSGVLINTAAGGQNAYVTNLQGNYSNNEISVLASPCFNLASLERPMLSFDFISALQVNRDGVVLEYNIGGSTWNSLGVSGEGVNWFNTFTNYSVGDFGKSIVWTGDGVDLSLDNIRWRSAKYRLEDVLGQSGVRFRFVFGSDDDGINEGFGIDNFRIADRSRIILLEHFANPNEVDFVNTQDDLQDIVRDNPSDVVLSQFFTSYPSTNTISNLYPAGPSARTLYYGVSQVPYSIVDGGDRHFNYSSINTLHSSDIRRRALEVTKYDITVRQGVEDRQLSVYGKIRAKEDIPSVALSSRIAVVEKSVEHEGMVIQNVLRAMLPDPAGTLIERQWNHNDSVVMIYTWQIPEGVNADSLVSIVFLQDEQSNEIYQTAYIEDFSIVTSVEQQFNLGNNYRIYPNPFSDYFSIRFTETLKRDVKVELFNNIGTLVKNITIRKGQQVLYIEMNDLPVGVYYIRLNSEETINSTKLIKIN